MKTVASTLGCPSSEYLRQMAAWFSGGCGSSEVILRGVLLVLQAAILDCVPFEPFSFQQDGFGPSEVDVSRS